MQWTHLFPQTSSQSSLLIITDPDEPGKVASGVTFLQSLDKFGADCCLCKKSVTWPSYMRVGTYLVVYQGYQGRRALRTCRRVWMRTGEWRLDCESRWINEKRWNSFGGERERRWRKKDDFSEDFSECSRRPILGHAWLFCALSSYSPFSALAILCILPRISSSLLFNSTSKLNSRDLFNYVSLHLAYGLWDWGGEKCSPRIDNSDGENDI